MAYNMLMEREPTEQELEEVLKKQLRWHVLEGKRRWQGIWAQLMSKFSN